MYKVSKDLVEGLRKYLKFCKNVIFWLVDDSILQWNKDKNSLFFPKIAPIYDFKSKTIVKKLKCLVSISNCKYNFAYLVQIEIALNLRLFSPNEMRACMNSGLI